MITHIRMKNFKSWKESPEVRLAPLTGFFGTNSSGKSSLLQMLLLLKQNVGYSSRPIIFFGDESSFVNLGNFHEVIHGHNEEEQLELEFGCKLKEPFKMRIYGKKADGQHGDVLVLIDNFTFNTVIHEKGMDLLIDGFRYSFESCEIPEVKWERGFLQHTDLLGQQNSQQISTTNCYGGPYQGQPHRLLRPLSFAFEKLFSDVYYLGPTRVDPQRRYSWNGGHPQHVRQWGNQTVDALLSARVRKLKTLHQEEEVPIEDRVSHWLQEMELAHSFSLDWASQGSKEYEVRIQKTPSSPPVTLVDMGYGLSQFLPVLVFCYYIPVGSTLILEQPGIHLHPKVQSQLADLLIEVITERKLQVLIESHSEHLLTRLQLRIAEKKIGQDETALYFCRNDEGTSTAERLKVSESGEIENWPENFFGDVMGDMFAMTDVQSEQMAEQNPED